MKTFILAVIAGTVGAIIGRLTASNRRSGQGEHTSAYTGDRPYRTSSSVPRHSGASASPRSANALAQAGW